MKKGDAVYSVRWSNSDKDTIYDEKRPFISEGEVVAVEKNKANIRYKHDIFDMDMFEYEFIPAPHSWFLSKQEALARAIAEKRELVSLARGMLENTERDFKHICDLQANTPE